MGECFFFWGNVQNPSAVHSVNVAFWVLWAGAVLFQFSAPKFRHNSASLSAPFTALISTQGTATESQKSKVTP
jgi:hypothetical protein